MSTWSNILTVARREYLVRARTRSFVIGTLLLVAGVIAIAFVPLIINRVSAGTTDVAIAADEPGLAQRAVTSIGTMLNAPAAGTTGTADASQPQYALTVVTDVGAARTQVLDGQLDALLVIARQPRGELAFTFYSKDVTDGRDPTLARQAATAFAVSDRLDRAGVSAGDRSALFAPAQFEERSADPADTQPITSVTAGISQGMLGFGMTILIFMIIIMYGNWVAMSVVEEKSSRVMEVVLNAATPFQLLTGKVVGVGGVAFTQYIAVVAAGLVALLLQDPVTSLVAGSSASLDLPQGLTPPMLVAFAAFGVLGFLLYASLYAAAGSLVSRQEDVNSVVMPMTLVSMVGYLAGVYASMGLIDSRAAWVVGLAVVPLTSPFMMLGRIAVGDASAVEVVLSLALLVGAIAVALWVAARIYAVGVLLYGSRPGARKVFQLLREGM
jgi:ABC-2 type transport system permease protein